ncbi:helix-turn-helix transcriptional regulator [Desemzia sp. RIT804]|uniref:helix-turn-helix domain-containing protein n=1 Tax=Desemzia sp. RIT 804 TaxID=2810209 RepID=UPI0019514F03|nr:helix-turn-helix transcriptional regulator [Desemzia sp. RIT 804]MBM6615383.1 helix-turn-helix transcriptional regulator [Desemzia sp. RIT 804]
MSLTHVSIGATLKKIRENKGYTQKEISDDTMARSTYTKFERNDITPTLSKYLAILDHLDMPHEEFLYLLNDYTLGEKETILYLFKQLEKKLDLALLDEIIEKGEQLVQERYDQLILDILNACRGYKVLFQENDLSKAKKHAKKAWERLETLDYWYLTELHVLNSILYVFDSEAAVMLTEQALSNLKRYTHFEEAATLKISFLLHLTNLLMMDKKYAEALPYLEQMEAASRDSQNLIMWATALVRKEVCLTETGDTTEHGLINKAIQLFELLDKKELKSLVEKDPENFYNLYAAYPAEKIKDELTMN